ARLTQEYGFTWVQIYDEDTRPERNGYGGSSMLVQYSSTGWATVEPVSGYAFKLDVMRTIEDVLIENGLSSLYPLNDPATGIDPKAIAKLYGETDPRKQVLWEWYADAYPDPARFYAVMTDLANDATGEYRASREATSARTGEPLEGLQLGVVADELLTEADEQAFRDAMDEYR